MDNQNKEMTTEEMDKEFKNMMFKALSRNNPGVHMDEDGYIVVPTLIRRRKPSGASNINSQKTRSQDDKKELLQCRRLRLSSCHPNPSFRKNMHKKRISEEIL